MPGRKPTETDLARFEAMLLHMRALVTGDLSDLEQDAFGIDGERAGVDSVADGGSDSYCQEFSLELMELDENSLREIDRALQRLKQGSFGRCLGCGCWISVGRLRAVPHTPNCIECQRTEENG